MDRKKIIWITGLPSSGKTTIAEAVVKILEDKEVKTFHIDGDKSNELAVKHGLTSLGFSMEERKTRVLRALAAISEALLTHEVVVASLISPLQSMRDLIRSTFTNYHNFDFKEVHLKIPVKTCIKRDVKGLYKKAINGEIKEFTGISSPYEEPLSPEVTITEKDQEKETPEEIAKRILA